MQPSQIGHQVRFGCCSHIHSHNQVRGHRTGSSHSGVEEYPREKHKQNQKWYTHISLQTQFMPSPKEFETVKSGVSLRCARSILVHTSHYSRLKTPTTLLATQKGLPCIYYTWYLSLRIRTTDASQFEKINKEKK